MKKGLCFLLVILLLFLCAGCGQEKTPDENPETAPEESAEPASNGQKPFTPEDMQYLLSELKTVKDWVLAADRSDGYYVSTMYNQNYDVDGLTVITMGMTDWSASISVSIPGPAQDEFYETLPEEYLKLPVKRVDSVHLDWLGLSLPRGGEIGDSIEDIKNAFLISESAYQLDPEEMTEMGVPKTITYSVLYDISALYPGTNPAAGELRYDGKLSQFVGGVYVHGPSEASDISDTNTIEYVWVSSPDLAIGTEICTLIFSFDEDGRLFECSYHTSFKVI